MTSSPMFRSTQPSPESKLPKSKDNPNLESIWRTKNHLPTKPNCCGWSTITTNLCNTTTSKSNNKPQSEFQPINLTQTSLDMCTEVLGSETGKGCFDLVDFFPVTCDDSGETKKKKKTNERMWSTRPATVPPSCPMLKSMVGGNTVRTRRCRENGKCVLKATMEPSSCFLVVTQRSVGSDGECPTLSIRYFDRNQAAFTTKHSGGLSSRLVTRYHPVKQVDEEGEEEVEEVSEEEEFEEIGSVQMGEYRRGRYECKEEEMAAAVAVAVASGQNSRYTSDVSTIRCC